MRINYLILNLLYRSDAKSKLIAATQKDIIEGLASEGEVFNERTIYNHLRELLKLGYIKEGMRKGNGKTFYVSTIGMSWLKEMEEEEQED